MDQLTDQEQEFLKSVLEKRKKVAIRISAFPDNDAVMKVARREVTLCNLILEKLFDNCPF